MYARVVQEPGRSRLLHHRRCGAGAAQEMVRVLGECVRPWGSEGGRKRWYCRAKGTKRGGRGGEKSESADSTGEAGEPAPRDPVEGSGRPGGGTCGGTDGGDIGPEGHQNATTQDSDMGIAAKPQPEEPDA